MNMLTERIQKDILTIFDCRHNQSNKMNLFVILNILQSVLSTEAQQLLSSTTSA